MNHRDNVINAINHQSADRIPYSIELCQDTIEVHGDQLLKDFSNKEVLADYHAGLLTKSEAISLCIGNHMTATAPIWWDWDYQNMDPSYHDAYAVPSVMPPVIRYNTDKYEEYRQKAKLLHEKYHTYVLCTIYGSHWEKAYFTRGIENFLADIAGEPEFSQQLLNYIIDTNMPMLEKMAECEDYDGILLGSDWGTQNDLIMSPATWRNLIKDGEKKQYELIKSHGKHVFIHSCGCILRVLDDLVELGVDVLNPVQPECMDLAFLKSEYGNKLTFWGGISTQKTLPYGTPEEVRKETESVIKLMSEQGGYITCSSQGIQTDVPYENLKALIETAQYFG